VLKAARAKPDKRVLRDFRRVRRCSLIHRQESKPELQRAIYEAMADRISSMAHRLGINPDVVLLGGVAKDVWFCCGIESKLSVNVLVPNYPDFAGALGAALIAASRVGGERK